MVKKHGKKQRARNKSRRTGAAYAAAAANTTHKHTPLPDMSVLEGLPHVRDRELDLDLAARLVAACRTGCQPCQRSLAKKMVDEDRVTLTALAAAPFSTLPTVGAFASPTTRDWAPLARAGMALAKEGPTVAAVTDMLQGQAVMGSKATALTSVEQMTPEQASELLEDALDHWAMGGATPEQLADMIKVISPQDLGMDPEDVAAAVDPQTEVSIYADRVAGTDDAGAAGNPYGLHLGFVDMPDGRPLPLITFEPRGEKAGLDHLRDECRWQPWNGRSSDFPELDFNWRIRMDIASQALEEIAHTDRDGWDDITLWRGEAKVPADWWRLLDMASHALLCGPVSSPDPDTLLAAAAKGELVAVIARASFM